MQTLSLRMQSLAEIVKQQLLTLRALFGGREARFGAYKHGE
jgi:hypothetical protein